MRPTRSRAWLVPIAMLAWTASAAQPTPIALHGTLVDVTCFARARAAEAQGHEASRCSRERATDPVGIVVDRGGERAFYVLATPPDVLSPHIGREARLEGERSPLGDIVRPKTLEVRSGGGWQGVTLLPDM